LKGLHFRRQQVVDGFIVDFYCHAASLIVEVDGLIHEQQADADAQRDQILSARGFRILRISNEEIHSSQSEVLRRILSVCEERTSSPEERGER
jgi:very-short-patch-repair endonuclease